jgi:RHS repeat-associated protein
VPEAAWEAVGWKAPATGNRLFHSALKALPFQSLSRFSGRRAKPRQNAEVGRGFFGARYYNSHISVWLSVDPIIKPFESPYVYCFNNPVRFIDPTGMDSDPIEKFNRKKEKYESKGGHWRGRNLTRYLNKHQDELNMYQAKFDKERREVTYIKGNNLGGSSKKIGNTKSGDPMLLGSKYIHELVTIKGKQDFGAHVISFVNLFAAAGPAGIYFDWGIIIDSYSDVQFYTTIGWAFGAGVCVGFGYSYIDKEISCEEFAEGEVDGFQGTVLSTPISLEIYGDYTNGAQNEYLFDNYRGRGGNVGFGSSYGGYRGKTVVSPVPAADFWCRPGRHF